jgi:hypothetical protein
VSGNAAEYIGLRSMYRQRWMGSVMTAVIVSHQADERDVVRVDGRARTIVISIDGWREGVDVRVLRSTV